MPANSAKTKKQKEMHGKSSRASLDGCTFSGRSSSTSSAKCTAEYALKHDNSTNICDRDTSAFPLYKEPLEQFLLDDTARFKRNTLIDKKDLKGLISGNPTDKENCLRNFIINDYWTEASVQGFQAEAIGWDTFEKVVGHRPPNTILKGKARLPVQDIVLIPLNPGLSKHW